MKLAAFFIFTKDRLIDAQGDPRIDLSVYEYADYSTLSTTSTTTFPAATLDTTTLPTTTLDTTIFPDGNRGTTVDFFGDFTSTTPLPTTSFSQTLETRTTSTFPLATAFTGEFQTTSTFPLATAFTLPEGLKGIGAAPQTKGLKKLELIMF